MPTPIDIDEISGPAYVSTGHLPPAERVDTLLAEAYERFKTVDVGKVADYIPALARTPRNLFGLSVVETSRSYSAAPGRGCRWWRVVLAGIVARQPTEPQSWAAARFVEHLGVEPTDNRTAAARPQRVVLVEAELQMMRLEAGIDERVLHRRRVEHRELPTALL
jgi:hypothetical protein